MGDERRHGHVQVGPLLANGAILALVALLLGIPIGLAVWLFLFVMGWAMDLVWEALPAWLGVSAESGRVVGFGSTEFPLWLLLAVTVVGALLLAANERRNRRRGVHIVPIMEVLARAKSGARYDWRLTGDYALAALLPLVFGASVGPEAGLTNVAAALATRVGDAAKALALECRAATVRGRVVHRGEVGAALRADGSKAQARPANVSPTGLGTSTTPAAPDPFAHRWQKIATYVLIGAGGVAVLQAMSALLGGGLSFPRLDDAAWSRELLLWALPCVAVGIAGGVFFDAMDVAAARLATALGPHTVVRNLIVAVALSLAGIAVPYVLFSGEEDLGSVVAGWQELGVVLLVAMALLRCVLAPLCIRCGWDGGQFFPLIFIGVTLGFAMAAATGADPTFCAACSSAALLGVVMRRPLMAALIMLIVMPVPMLPPMLVAALVGALIPLPQALGAAPAKRFGRRAGERG